MKVERNELISEREQIRSNILTMGWDINNLLIRLQDVLAHFDVDSANEIANGDAHFNQLYQTINDECLILIARHQPVASDLREIIADLQVAVELERMADHIASMAQLVQTLSAEAIPPVMGEVMNMITRSSEMMSGMLKAYQERDADRAETIAGTDETIDAMNQQIVEEIIEFMKEDSHSVETGSHLIWLVHHLERIADRVTNIGEQIAFNSSGKMPDWNASSDL